MKTSMPDALPRRATGFRLRLVATAVVVGGAALLVASLVVTVRLEERRIAIDWPGFTPWQMQSLVCLALAAGLLIASRAASARVRAWSAAAIVATLFGTTIAVPLHQRIRMGDYATYTASRRSFDTYTGAQSVRFEAYLSTTLLRLIDRSLGATERTPVEAFVVLGKLAAAWCAAMLLLAMWVAGCSAAALRYAALCVAAPLTLMYFGYRELGYLSLNAAVYPLIAEGLRGARGRFEAGCALSGLGAALHGFGLLALAGAAASAVVSPLRASERFDLALKAFSIGTSVYLIWIFVYIVGMGLDIVPGHAGSIPWRPLLVSTLAEHRVNHAIASARGAAEILTTAWIAGVPLLALVLTGVRGSSMNVRAALAYVLPSAVFLCAFWPVQGIAVDGDLIFGAFPGIYALIWLAAQRVSTSWMSLVLLATGHVVFWRVMFGDAFVNPRVY